MPTRQALDTGPGENLSLGAWSLRAGVTGAALIIVGALVGGGFGLTVDAETGGLAALCIVAVGGIFWAIKRIGAVGIGLGMIGGIAALLGATEIRHAVVVQGPMTSLPSLAAWNPGSGVSVMQVAPVQGDLRYRSLSTKSQGGGKGRGVTSVQYRVVPLREDARVVGFTCSNSLHPGRSGVAGAFVLATAAWDGTAEPSCRQGIGSSERWLRAAGIELAPGATGRIVRVYASEADLRADHDAPLAFWGPGIFLAVYLAGCILFRVMQGRKKRKVGPGARAG